MGVVLRGPVLPKCWLADGAVPGRLRGELGLRTGSRNCSSDDAMVCVRWERRVRRGAGAPCYVWGCIVGVTVSEFTTFNSMFGDLFCQQQKNLAKENPYFTFSPNHKAHGSSRWTHQSSNCIMSDCCHLCNPYFSACHCLPLSFSTTPDDEPPITKHQQPNPFQSSSSKQFKQFKHPDTNSNTDTDCNSKSLACPFENEG